MVERAATPAVGPLRRRLLGAARALTTPLLPDDYLGLLHPRLSAREATGTVVSVTPDADGAATVRIRPHRRWAGHRAGQYLRLGVEIDGVRHWRAYTITADPGAPDGLLAITVKRVEGGRVSPFLTGALRPATLVWLGDAEGTFVLPDAPADRVLLVSAGSGVTPVAALARDLERRGDLRDVVHLHGARRREDVILAPVLEGLAARQAGYRLVVRPSATEGRITPAALDELCPDWRDRATFLSGPRGMLDAFVEHWAADPGADPARLAVERFQPSVGTGEDAAGGTGGTVRFARSGVQATCTPGVSMLVGGEAAGAALPSGCRMGICHTCVGRLEAGVVRDLRTGELRAETGRMVRTCVHAPEGPVELAL